MGMPYVTLMPVFAKDILHGGPHSMGFLMGASGIGALIGAIYLASKKTVLGLGRVIASTSAVFGLALVCFSFSHLLWLSLILMLFTGYGQMVQMAASNTILQTITDDDKRGRVMSFYTMAFMGMTPFGSIFSGSLADKIGAPATIFIGGIACLAGSALFILKLPALKK
jgi:MFS family permease